MDYFKVNYDKLRNLKETKYYLLIIIIIILFLICLVASCFIRVSKMVTCYGVINDGVLKIVIDNRLSDTLKNNNTLKFNNTYLNYEILKYGNYEVVNGNFIIEVALKVDGVHYENEIGNVTIYYDGQRLCKYILELFKWRR